ncbi:hypothetical protein PLESTB_001255600 [Pleodorina starrii]|uniref:Uncharacterized protein n=1 Tax=Pleodorina starrii TaxID=330485 RepID=A0A9W6F643_9CHLO|nr:hypothetical protein PLESTM_000204400 [Pleodorina starrii]GLC57703.1 hypothetical protein PLESTB_001255600 [Pleodorina starrii]GLC63373.1 hypothetical protein PLESTF_000029400 [Pleodorina starrii]
MSAHGAGGHVPGVWIGVAGWQQVVGHSGTVGGFLAAWWVSRAPCPTAGSAVPGLMRLGGHVEAEGIRKAHCCNYGSFEFSWPPPREKPPAWPWLEMKRALALRHLARSLVR